MYMKQLPWMWTGILWLVIMTTMAMCQHRLNIQNWLSGGKYNRSNIYTVYYM